jgi:hypothetical protein
MVCWDFRDSDIELRKVPEVCIIYPLRIRDEVMKRCKRKN